MNTNCRNILLLATAVFSMVPFVALSEKHDQTTETYVKKREWTEGFRPSMFLGTFDHSLSEIPDYIQNSSSEVNTPENSVNKTVKYSSNLDLSDKVSTKTHIKDSENKVPKKKEQKKIKKVRYGMIWNGTVWYTPKIQPQHITNKRYICNILKTNEIIFGPGGLSKNAIKNAIDQAVLKFGDATIGRGTGQLIRDKYNEIWTGMRSKANPKATQPITSKPTILPKTKSKIKTPEGLKKLHAKSRIDKQGRKFPGLASLLFMTLLA